jgi:hypothetical protein
MIAEQNAEANRENVSRRRSATAVDNDP